jgi:hypothetical protein
MDSLSEQTLNRVLVTVLDVQDRVVKVEEDVAYIKQQQDVAFGNLDGFIHLIDRHETEIAALRSADHRLEQRINTL